MKSPVVTTTGLNVEPLRFATESNELKGNSMARKEFSAQNAVAIGPYSHAIEAGDMIYLSGQTPIDSATGQLVVGDISAQAKQCFSNLHAVLRAAGLDSDSVIKVNVFLVDMNDFAAMNAVYQKQFAAPYPARTTIGVASLPLGAKIEIELIARRG
jgi:2-iminobutanoate/2-iminopropanoate deaminase